MSKSDLNEALPHTGTDADLRGRDGGVEGYYALGKRGFFITCTSPLPSLIINFGETRETF